MTRDEILAMPAGTEMDALVATRVHGWTRYKYPTWNAYEWRDRDGRFTYHDDPDEWCPSECIADAMGALEHWRAQKPQRAYTITSRPTGFLVVLSNAHSVEAETLPLAICRALLLAAENGGAEADRG